MKDDPDGKREACDLRDAFVCHGAIVDVVHGTLELFQNEVHASTSGQQHMGTVADSALLCPFGRPDTAITRQVGAFGKQEQPHRIKVISAIRGCVQHLQLPQAVSQTRLVHGHLARHEDESVEHHAWADDRNVLQGLFQNDIKVTMHLRFVRIAYPPQI